VVTLIRMSILPVRNLSSTTLHVYIGISQRTVISCGREGDCKSGITMVMNEHNVDVQARRLETGIQVPACAQKGHGTL